VKLPPAVDARLRSVLVEVVRFLLVGGAATVISVVGFNWLVNGLRSGTAPLADRPVLAFVLANLVAGCAAYAGMRLWAFRDRDLRDPSGGVVRFFGLGALTMAIPVLCLWVSRRVLGLDGVLADNLAANVIGLGLGTAARFWVFSRYVFDEAVPSEQWAPTT